MNDRTAQQLRAAAFGFSASMARQTIKPGDVVRFALGCLVVSTLAAIAFWLGRDLPWVRGPSAGVGIMATLFGSGVAFWFSARGGERGLFSVALYSLVPLAFWSWAVYKVVHG
jgi:hypothetical protein